ncbi:glycosyltransferase family 2 protein [Flavobacteriaceae bacterium]|nr:glycosyltransferase family 2 protein [Flavobacteriaceae bacterium]
MTHELTFIIVTFNSSKIISETLSSIDQSKYNVIVVDNASTDNTAQIIKNNFPQTALIENPKNVGFGRGNNIGFEKVQTEFTCVLNPDCFVDDKSIVEILKTLKANPNIAIANGVPYSGYLNNKTQKIITTKIDEIAAKGQTDDKGDYYNVTFISGCCIFFKKEILKKIGLFYKNFFIYCEDNELCKRVMKNKYQIATVKNAKITHLSGKSSDLSNPKIAYAILWHKFGWSKCYYTQAVHNKLIAKLKAIKNIIKRLIIIAIKKQKPILVDKAILNGCFGYLVGKKAFDKMITLL